MDRCLGEKGTWAGWRMGWLILGRREREEREFSAPAVCRLVDWNSPIPSFVDVSELALCLFETGVMPLGPIVLLGGTCYHFMYHSALLIIVLAYPVT